MSWLLGEARSEPSLANVIPVIAGELIVPSWGSTDGVRLQVPSTWRSNVNVTTWG